MRGLLFLPGANQMLENVMTGSMMTPHQTHITPWPRQTLATVTHRVTAASQGGRVPNNFSISQENIKCKMSSKNLNHFTYQRTLRFEAQELSMLVKITVLAEVLNQSTSRDHGDRMPE